MLDSEIFLFIILRNSNTLNLSKLKCNYKRKLKICKNKNKYLTSVNMVILTITDK